MKRQSMHLPRLVSASEETPLVPTHASRQVSEFMRWMEQAAIRRFHYRLAPDMTARSIAQLVINGPGIVVSDVQSVAGLHPGLWRNKNPILGNITSICRHSTPCLNWTRSDILNTITHAPILGNLSANTKSAVVAASHLLRLVFLFRMTHRIVLTGERSRTTFFGTRMLMLFMRW